MKILLVEDNELNRDMLTRRLERMEYIVLCAKNGQEAIEIAQSDNPDIILMDLSLPIMDGWTAAQRLKSNSITKSIPIIALTAHAMKGDREKALEAGCDDYDTKPIDFERLLKKIDTLTANEINKLFCEIVIAPSYAKEALIILKEKKNRILLIQKEHNLSKKMFMSNF